MEIKARFNLRRECYCLVRVFKVCFVGLMKHKKKVRGLWVYFAVVPAYDVIVFYFDFAVIVYVSVRNVEARAILP